MPISRLSAIETLLLELRPLPSTVVTRLQRYYEPLRRPKRPGLSLAGVRLITRSHRWGLPCCVRSPYANMPSPLPRWDRRRVRRSPYACDGGLPRVSDGSAPTANVSRPARRSLALRPAGSRGRPRRPFPSDASAVSLPPLPLRLLPAGTTGAGWELYPPKIDTLARSTATPFFPFFLPSSFQRLFRATSIWKSVKQNFKPLSST